eukprot:TRINITY_DN34638_c0_g3_i1.p1 TRINITY_DN34638_c0_g3~~TRINITY_DN34638_c0_g3_i1.p1  ORF type:complete len:1002 (-),score=171.91 TRINITY_DN34638_c0_g3_i1:56-3061(-)
MSRFAKEKLARILQKFIKGVSPEQLSIRQLLSGSIEFGPGVPLVEEAVQQALVQALGPPCWEITRAEAGNVTVHIPWTQMRWHSTEIKIDKLEIDILLHDPADLEAALFEQEESEPPHGVHGEDGAQPFCKKQRERFMALAAAKRRKLRTAHPHRQALPQAAVNGVAASFGRLIVSFFATNREAAKPPCFAREDESDEATLPPSRLEAVVEIIGATLSPCSESGEATMQMEDARGLEPEHKLESNNMPELPNGLRVWSTRVILQAETVNVLLPGDGGDDASNSRASMNCAVKMRDVAMRSRIPEACAVRGSAEFLLSSNAGRCLGLVSEVEVGHIPVCSSRSAIESSVARAEASDNEDDSCPLTVQLNEAELATLLRLHGDFDTSASVYRRWRMKLGDHEKQDPELGVTDSSGILEACPKEVASNTSLLDRSDEGESSGTRSSEEGSHKADGDKDEEAVIALVRIRSLILESAQSAQGDQPENGIESEERKRSPESTLKGWWSATKAGLLRSPTRSICSEKHACFEDAVYAGWLVLNRYGLKADRWCELHRLPNSDDAYALHMFSSKSDVARKEETQARPLELRHCGEIRLAPGCKIEVRSFGGVWYIILKTWRRMLSTRFMTHNEAVANRWASVLSFNSKHKRNRDMQDGASPGNSSDASTSHLSSSRLGQTSPAFFSSRLAGLNDDLLPEDEALSGEEIFVSADELEHEDDEDGGSPRQCEEDEAKDKEIAERTPSFKDKVAWSGIRAGECVRFCCPRGRFELELGSRRERGRSCSSRSNSRSAKGCATGGIASKRLSLVAVDMQSSLVVSRLCSLAELTAMRKLVCVSGKLDAAGGGKKFFNPELYRGLPVKAVMEASAQHLTLTCSGATSPLLRTELRLRSPPAFHVRLQSAGAIPGSTSRAEANFHGWRVDVELPFAQELATLSKCLKEGKSSTSAARVMGKIHTNEPHPMVPLIVFNDIQADPKSAKQRTPRTPEKGCNDRPRRKSTPADPRFCS